MPRKRPRLHAALAFALVLPAAACDLPRPFAGYEGANARRLAHPPPSRLAVPPPGEALLSDAAAAEFSDDLVRGLRQAEVPAFAKPVSKGDWTLVTTAEQRPGGVVPVFTVLDPTGKDDGRTEGKPVPAEQWAAGDPAALAKSADESAVAINSLLQSIQVALIHADPHSLYNRPAKVVVRDVTGAPGDGDPALTRQMKAELAKLGPQVQDSTRDADFIVAGDVKVVPIAGGQVRVEIQWTVADAASGGERGKIVQLNEVPPETVNRYWGDVALAVAQEAAGGVRDVLLTQAGRR